MESNKAFARMRHGRRRSRQGGAVAIEFALTFVIFFAVFYAIVSYSFPLLLMQNMHTAAAEGVRVAIQVDPAADDAVERMEVLSAEHAERIMEDARMLALFPGDFEITADMDEDVLEVTIVYDYAQAPLLVPIELPGIGPVPRMPGDLRAQASIDM
ncbi:TadE/TadG family type IV pilus assembly protein [Thioalkalivibrio sp. ALJ24]|uniref:TadE/TadG family type IV pilus assembly protein n=1 Tax=Thioalkalivibrio sp. ALJ24 TaxID=545276 RepID=UPI00036DCB72|nr:TadE family protein [Thioalkalivibrio sp. ALJ24]